MLDHGFNYWFTDHEHVRSPFPEAIRDELKSKTTERFSEWMMTLGEDAASELDEKEMVEMFEMFLFNVGISLAKDLDQKITITYPFMPRCGDEVDDAKYGKSSVVQREIIEKEEEKRQLRLVLKTKTGDKTWQTEFDLPA